MYRTGAVNFLRGVSFLAPFLLVGLFYVDEPYIFGRSLLPPVIGLSHQRHGITQKAQT